MIIWGINALGHDASISAINSSGEILFAAHAERYSRKKNEYFLNDQIVSEAATFGLPDQIVWYEKPFKKRLRQLYAGQLKEALSLKNSPAIYLKNWNVFKGVPISYVGHHQSHAAAGYFTSGFKTATIVVADAIGEWDTVTIWKAQDNEMKLIKRWSYPSSLGLLYSAFCERVGLKPNEEEYILMGMAAYGKPIYRDFIFDKFLDPRFLLRFKENPHIGLGEFLADAKKEDLASSIQLLTEQLLIDVFHLASELCPSENVVYMGGLALNCVANSKIAEKKFFKNMWIFPNPGDAGSSLGAAAAFLGRQLLWKGPYLGSPVGGDYPVESLLKELLSQKIVGVANGRSEFGPRALGNRSLFADPRDKEVRDRVNKIKKRQEFRPFAPVILQEHWQEWFDGPYSRTPYMQFVSKCKFPEKVPAICHFDNTSRVQTLKQEDHPQLYLLLQRWYKETGCPMLLNTSLNIKGQPLVNDEEGAQSFEKKYGIKVFLRDEIT